MLIHFVFVVRIFLLLFVDAVVNERVHDEPVDFTEKAARVFFLFGYDDVAAVVQHVARQVSGTARPLALHSAGTLKAVQKQ